MQIFLLTVIHIFADTRYREIRKYTLIFIGYLRAVDIFDANFTEALKFHNENAEYW